MALVPDLPSRGGQPQAVTVVVDDLVFAAQQNQSTLTAKAQAALTTNATFLAIASPSNAQVSAQVTALTKEATAIIRLLLNQFDSTAGT